MEVGKADKLSFIIGMPCSIEKYFYKGGIEVIQLQTSLHSAVRTPEQSSSFYWNYFKVDIGVPVYTGGLMIPNYEPLVKYFASAISLVFGKKVKLVGITSQGAMEYLPVFDEIYEFYNRDAPVNSSSPRVDFPVDLNIASFSIVDKFLSSILRMDNDKEIDNYGRYLNMYSQSLSVFESMPDVSFLSLICCSELFNHISKGEGDKERKKLIDGAQSILDNMREKGCERRHIDRVAEKFSPTSKALNEKIVSYLDSQFFERSESLDQDKRLTSENAPEAIKRAYGLRSKYVHSGSESGLGTMSSVSGGVVEVWGDLNRSGKIDKNLSKSLSLVGLERVVRFCMLKHANDKFNLCM